MVSVSVRQYKLQSITKQFVASDGHHLCNCQVTQDAYVTDFIFLCRKRSMFSALLFYNGTFATISISTVSGFQAVQETDLNLRGQNVQQKLINWLTFHQFLGTLIATAYTVRTVNRITTLPSMSYYFVMSNHCLDVCQGLNVML